MSVEAQLEDGHSRVHFRAPEDRALISPHRVLARSALLLSIAGFDTAHLEADSSSAPQDLGHPAADPVASREINFIPNNGQFPPEVAFFVPGAGGECLLTNTGLLVHRHDSYSIAKPRDLWPGDEHDARTPDSTRVRGFVLGTTFLGAGARPPRGAGPQRRQRFNYLIGGAPNAWTSNVRPFGEVIYSELYPGIDLRYYQSEGRLKYDLVIQPGANPSLVRFRYEGADSLSIDEGGALRIHTRLGTLVEDRPLAFELLGGTKRIVEARYRLLDATTLGYTVEKPASGAELTIDPGLAWSTFLGGGGLQSGDDDIHAVTVSASGAVFVTGWTESMTFPTSTGAYDTTHNGDFDGFVVKLAPDGSTIEFATLLGGSSTDSPEAIVVDSTGNVIVAGYTGSIDFPTTPGAFDVSHNGGPNDWFIAKLDATGGDLLSSTFLGGSGDDFCMDVASDADGSLALAGWSGVGFVQFPTTPGVYDTVPNGGNEAIVAKLSADGAELVFSTYVNSFLDDRAYVVRLDPAGNPVIGGYTTSTMFPSTPGAYDSTHNGGSDAFIAKVSSDGHKLLMATFLGGGHDEHVVDMDIDAQGRIGVTGGTRSINFPRTPNAYSHARNCGRDAFVAILRPEGNELEYSTYLGGGCGVHVDEFGACVRIFSSGDVVVGGATASPTFPVTEDAFDPTFNGGTLDLFVAQISTSIPILRYATYFGGTDTDNARSFCMSGDARIFAAGFTFSPDFPTTPGSYDSTFECCGSDGFVACLELPPAVTGLGEVPGQGDAHPSLEGESRSRDYGLRIEGPNPLRSGNSLAIEYAIGSQGHVRVAVHDVSGRLVKLLVDRVEGAGSRRILARQGSDLQLRAGPYVVSLAVDGARRASGRFVFIP